MRLIELKLSAVALSIGLLLPLALVAAEPSQALPPAAEVPAAAPLVDALPVIGLAEILKSASLNSRNLAIKQSELRGAEAGLREAQSRYWPSLTHNLSASFMVNPPDGLSIAAGSLGTIPSASRYPTPFPTEDIVLMADPENTYFKVGADINWPIITWGKIEAAAAIAREQVGIATMQVEKTARENRRDLQKAYFGAILARQSTELLKEMESMFSRIVQDKELSYAQGTVNFETVLDSRAKLASIQYQRTKADQGYKSALAGIAFMASLPDGSWQPDADFPDADPILNPDLLIKAARENSLERSILQTQMDQASKARDIAFNTDFWRPDIGLNIKLDITGQRIPFAANWTDSWDWNVIISLGTQMTMFDGGKQLAKTDQAAEKVKQASIGLAMIDQGLPVQIQRNLEAALTATATLKDKMAGAALAQERDKNAQSAFTNEMATREEAQGARIALIMAKIEVLGARFQQLTALADLEYLTNQQLLP